MRVTNVEAPSTRPALRLVSTAGSAPAAEVISRRVLATAIVTALFVGAFIRIGFVLASDFPLNDGGMFYAMASDLQRNDYRLPDLTTYNFDGIPFAYPPFGFYAAALLERATPLSMAGVLRVLPAGTSVLTMLAFAALARRFLRDRLAFAVAVFSFVLIPRSFEWMIMGGGLTRSFGLLFSLIALHEMQRLYETRRPYYAVTGGLMAALTALSHLEMAWFLAFSSLLLFIAQGRHRAGVLGSLGAAGIAGAGTAVWWLHVVSTHGLATFVAATTTSSPSQANPVVAFLIFNPTDEPMFSLIAALALIGVVTCVAKRQWFLPVWLLACGLLDPRAFGNVASVPVALLAGIGVADVLVPMLLRADDAQPVTERRRWILPGAVLGFLFSYAVLNAIIATPRLLTSLQPDEREAMSWVSTNTPPDSRFLVVTNDTWAVDRTSEWFPVLAARRSVATVQGYEWVRGSFREQLDSYRGVQLCADSDSTCIDAWSTRTGIGFDYIYVPKVAAFRRRAAEHPDECCAALRASLRIDARYRVVFDGPGATVFERRGSPGIMQPGWTTPPR